MVFVQTTNISRGSIPIDWSFRNIDRLSHFLPSYYWNDSYLWCTCLFFCLFFFVCGFIIQVFSPLMMKVWTMWEFSPLTCKHAFVNRSKIPLLKDLFGMYHWYAKPTRGFKKLYLQRHPSIHPLTYPYVGLEMSCILC